MSCFKDGDHRDHDYIMYRSETGGVCDCGDLESWAEAGCCRVHAPRRTGGGGGGVGGDTSADGVDSSANKTLPPGPRRDAAEAVIGVVAERLLLALESVARWGGICLPTPSRLFTPQGKYSYTICFNTSFV